MAFSAPGPCCMQNAPMLRPEVSGRSHPPCGCRCALPHHHRADIGVGGKFDEVIDRIAAEDLDALAFHDFRDCRTSFMTLLPLPRRFAPAICPSWNRILCIVKLRWRLAVEVLICV